MDGALLIRVGSAIYISDDETEPEQIKKSPRNRRRKPSKRSFEDYVETENLWMGSTLKDLEEILHSTRTQIKSLEAMEKMLIASQNFIRKCGAQEEKVTKRLENSE